MPARNGTGPFGQGARTGRGLGWCTTAGRGGFFGAAARGLGFGRRGAQGWSDQNPSLLQNIVARLEKIEEQLLQKER
jgi:hypothetical protein